MNREEHNAYNREWNRKHHKQRNAHARKWEQNNRTKTHARYAVHKAIKNGLLKRQKCKKCGSKVVHAHHPDYRRFLFIIWLCPRHHKEAHKKKK